MSVFREVEAGDLHEEIDRLFNAKGAGHNFQLGVLALAHALLEEVPANAGLRHQLLAGMVHVQANVVTMTTNEVSTLSRGIKEVLGVDDEEIAKAGAAVDKLHAQMAGQSSQQQE